MKRLLFASAILLAGGLAALSQVNTVPQIGVIQQFNTQKQTYSFGITGLVAAASATDIFYITGSSTKTVRISRVAVSGRATGAASADVRLIKRAANSGGTCTAGTVAPNDSANAAATATVTSCTANPTLGTAVAVVRTQQLFLGDLTTGAPGIPAIFTLGDLLRQPIVLRGTTQVLGVNLNAVTYSGNLFQIDTEFTEE